MDIYSNLLVRSFGGLGAFGNHFCLETTGPVLQKHVFLRTKRARRPFLGAAGSGGLGTQLSFGADLAQKHVFSRTFGADRAQKHVFLRTFGAGRAQKPCRAQKTHVFTCQPRRRSSKPRVFTYKSKILFEKAVRKNGSA